MLDILASLYICVLVSLGTLEFGVEQINEIHVLTKLLVLILNLAFSTILF